MIPYSNLSGDSAVVAYSTGDDFLRVQFRHRPKIYVYNSKKPGLIHVERMKELAVAGKGLATYISQNAKKNFFGTE